MKYIGASKINLETLETRNLSKNSYRFLSFPCFFNKL
uniref:Putative phospholipase A2 homolog 1 isoform X2 n=1 Tax=Rhizophora mucronata TaxID=61149 RepID=A0A2P2JPE1_RHIMU